MPQRIFLRLLVFVIFATLPRLFAWVPQEIPGFRYPRGAQLARIEGTVIVECTIAGDGTVSSAVIKSGHPVLADASAKIAKTWRFKRSGDDHETPIVRLTFEFRLVGSCKSQCCNETFLLQLPDHVLVTSELPQVEAQTRK
jgi:TonB family protein